LDLILVVASIILGIIVLFILLLVAVSIIAASKLAKPPRKVLKWTPRDLGLEYEDFVFKTRDGVELKGWLVKGSPTRAVIVIHGYTSSKWDEGYMKPAIEVLGRAGYTLLVVDMRAHGESGGEFTTLGYRESGDVVDMVSLLRGRGFKKVALYGFSMGGAISIMTASKTSVDAVVLDSPYVDVRASGRRWINRVKGPMGALLRIAYPLITRLVASKVKVDPSELVMYKYAERVKVPVLLVAPTRDDLISLDEYKSLYEALKKSSPSVEAWFVETGHVGAWADYRDEYERRLLSFLAKYMYM